ncbi:MAG TPA: hypothetical protein VFE62_11245 [Gemmataceae bacterium]|nr:hypothetical protein [Gemmataceae bacterium]
MVAAGLTAIFFVCTLVCWTIWSLLYSLVASHYFLTTLTDSSSGQAEVNYPREGFMDWWWKPLMCGWVLLFWIVPATLLLLPLLAISTPVYLGVWAMVLWVGFPLSLMSVLYAQHWLHFLHRGVIGRMLQHWLSFLYVHVVTLILCGGCAYLVVRGLTNIAWLIPAIALVPAAQLLYARHWGRFAWLSLNYLPRQPTKGSDTAAEEERRRAILEEDAAADGDLPPTENEELPTDEVEAAAEEAFRDGPPPAKTAAAIKPAPPPAPVGPVEEDDPWTDTKPYMVEGVASFEETAAPKPTPATSPKPAAPVAEEEEDEWSTNKKPYAFTDAEPAPEIAPSAAQTTKSEADSPLTMSTYYDERAKKLAEDKRRREAEARKMPRRRKKPPSFYAALVGGVWNFVLYPSTLMAWANLCVFTLVELLLMYVMVMFYPK